MRRKDGTIQEHFDDDSVPKQRVRRNSPHSITLARQGCGGFPQRPPPAHLEYQLSDSSLPSAGGAKLGISSEEEDGVVLARSVRGALTMGLGGIDEE